jgi:DNA invertase Pin-like site-specific DNA recombinase
MYVKVGYVRVSTQEQNTIRQEVLMQEMDADRVYLEKVSGKDTDRPKLKEMLTFVRSGDVVIVESISRFARNTRDLLKLVEQLATKGVTFISKKEAIDTNTPSGKFMLTVFGAVAELEREYTKQRQVEGIAEAKKAGKYKGRKPIEVDRVKFNAVYTQWKSGAITAVAAQKQLGLLSNTFYRRVKQYATDGNMGSCSPSYS